MSRAASTTAERAARRLPLPAIVLGTLLCFAGSVVTGQEIPGPDPRLPISVDADAAEFDGRSNRLVLQGLRITQGGLSIEAEHGEARRLEFEDALWEFRGNVRIGMEDSLLRSDEATLRFVDHRLVQATAFGAPALFEGHADTSGRRIDGEAAEIDYDLGAGTIRLTGNASLREGANEITGTMLLYNLLEERMLAMGDGDDGRVRITIVPPSGDDASMPRDDGDD